jgi:hypothetical protein
MFVEQSRILRLLTRMVLVTVREEVRSYWHWDYPHTANTEVFQLSRPSLVPINKTLPGPLTATPASRCHDYNKTFFSTNRPVRSLAY